MSSLAILAEYNSDSDEGSDETDESKFPTHKHMKLDSRLPLPLALNLSDTKQPEVEDDPELHDGRRRTYAHERGNWSSLVYIPYELSETFHVFCDQIIESCSPNIELKKIDEPHISLSRTFILYYHWIKEFCFSLKEKLKVISSFEINFDGIGIYCNENCSRTFLALTVGVGSRELSSSIEIIDDCLKEYKLKPFYKDASFHMSIAWCLGDKKKILEESMPEFIKIFELFKASSKFSFIIDHYLFKTGYKEFKITLK